MTRALPFLAMLAGACVPVTVPVPAPPAQRVIPAGAPPENYYFGSGERAIEWDLLATARERFGEAALRRALAGTSYLLAKIYPGMLPPPEAGAPPYKPPMALLVREDGQWLVATDAGFRPARAAKSAELDSIIESAPFRSAPTSGRPFCTDSGASLLMLKTPGANETIRDGTCGPTEPNERLARLALEA